LAFSLSTSARQSGIEKEIKFSVKPSVPFEENSSSRPLFRKKAKTWCSSGITIPPWLSAMPILSTRKAKAFAFANAPPADGDLNVQSASRPRFARVGTTTFFGDDVLKLFVGNLSWNTEESALREIFEQHGEVEEVRIVTDRDTGRSRGFAFVTFPNNDDANNAMAALNGTEVDGRSLNVNEARERQPRQRSNSW
jgi:heterogeneous nuclear ribonucleoprotein A1/A3